MADDSIEGSETGERSEVEPGPSLEAAAALAGSVAHDLGNMLTVVLGNAELLVEGLAGQPELLELADLILGAAQRGTELSGRLDRFARRIPIAPEPVDSVAELDRYAHRLAQGLPPGVRLDTAIPPDLPRIGLPASVLGAALDELMTNALAGLGGKGALRLAAERAAAADGEPLLRIVVEDNGGGMAPDLLQRHRRLRFSSGIAGHRTALGMALVMRVALAGGGGVKLDSTLGGGTRVTLELAGVS